MVSGGFLVLALYSDGGGWFNIVGFCIMFLMEGGVSAAEGKELTGPQPGNGVNTLGRYEKVGEAVWTLSKPVDDPFRSFRSRG